METLSTTENSILMAQARDALDGRWGLVIGTFVVYVLVIVPVSLIPIAGWIISLLISGSMSIGIAIFSLSVSRKQDAQLAQIFGGFPKFTVGLSAYLLMAIFVILWLLLLIVPGIIAALSYSLTYYIIAEDDSISALDAITKSKQMMRGNKLKLFCLGWRFIGWALLCILTVGIGLLWLYPYMAISFAQFYDDIKKQETLNYNPVADPI
jgi:uncharacterized membrane protein